MPTRQPRTRNPRTVTAIDAHVSRRLRELRTMRGIAQQALAGHLGVTFQQLQKYETGVNRISVSRLYQLAGVLNVPITWFYDGLDVPRENEAAASKPPKLARDPEFARLVRTYYQIKNAAARRRLREMASILAGAR